MNNNFYTPLLIFVAFLCLGGFSLYLFCPTLSRDKFNKIPFLFSMSARSPKQRHFNFSVFLNSSPDRYFVDSNIVRSQYLHHPAPCNTPLSSLYMMIAVITAPGNFGMRTAIRTTWGSLAKPRCGVRIIFVLGRVSKHETQRLLDQEARLHKEILQSNQYDDLYRSSTLKTLHLFQWCAAFCAHSKYIVRIDDDAWLNLPKYYTFLKENEMNGTIYGYTISSGAPVQRAPSDKYFLPREDYTPDKLPEYVGGFMFTTPTKYLPKLLHASHFMAYSFLDDVYVAGMLATASNMKRQYVHDYMPSGQPPRQNGTCPKRDAMTIHHSMPVDQYELWTDPCHSYKDLC